MPTPPELPGAPLTGANRFLLPDAQRQSQEAQALERRDAALAFALYQHYQLGLNQSEEAAPWLRRAADWGHPVAGYNLGLEHLDRYEKLGTDADRQAALQLFRASAAAGHERAAQRLRELD